MTDFIEKYYADSISLVDYGFDRERALKRAFSVVLPVIIKRELTEKQSLCLRYKYISGKNQYEIANMLHLSQPTVSRHIQTAKEVVNNRLCYCYAAVVAAIDEYDR